MTDTKIISVLTTQPKPETSLSHCSSLFPSAQQKNYAYFPLLFFFYNTNHNIQRSSG